MDKPERTRGNTEARSKDKYFYLQNLEMIDKYFKSSEYIKLKEKLVEFQKKEDPDGSKVKNEYLSDIRNKINNGYIFENNKYKEIYRDPDGEDLMLYQYINEKIYDKRYKICEKESCLMDGDIRLKLDGIAWKPLLNLCYKRCANENSFEKFEEYFKDYYETVRNPENRGHFLWPVQRVSINTERFKQFNDRIDYTLYDIKKILKVLSKHQENLENLKDDILKEEIKLDDTFLPDTISWLMKFSSFEDFIEKMKLDRWCYKDEEGYIVKNLSDLKEINAYPEGSKKYPNEQERERLYPITQEYINNVINTIK